MRRFLIVGSVHMRDSIVATLREAGYDVVVADNDLDALLLLKQDPVFALILGDIEVPKTLDTLRSEYPEIPVVILSDQGSIASSVQSILHGARDYLSAPIDRDTLLTSVDEAITGRRAASADRGLLHVRELTIDRRQSLAYFQKVLLPLTTTEFNILYYLMAEAGRVVTFEALVYLLQGTHVERAYARQMLSAHITHLRSKLRDAGCLDYLVNSRGRGYFIDTNFEEILRQTESRLRVLIQQAPVNLWTVSTDLHITWVSGQHFDMVDVTAEQMVGMLLSDVLNEDPNSRPIELHRQALAGESVRYETERKGYYYQVYLEPLRDIQDNVIGCIGVALDITERKQAEQRIAFQANVLSQINDAVVAVDMGMLVTYSNHAAEQLLGFKNDQVIGQTLSEILQDQWLSPEAQQTLRETLWATDSWRDELSYTRKDDQRIEVEISVSWLKDGAGENIGALAVMRDITVRKQAELELAAERTLLRTLIDNMPDYVFVKDKQSHFVLNNIASAGLISATPEQIIGKNDFDYSPPELAAQYYADDQAVIKSGAPLVNREEPILNLKTRQEGWVLTTKVPLRDSQGNIIGIVGIGRDITERKQDEEKLRQSEQRFRSTFEQAAVGITHVSLDGKWLRINQKMCDIVGYNHEELFERGWQSITHPDDLAADLLQANRLQAGEIETYALEKRYIRKDGSPVWVNLTASLVYDISDSPHYIVAVVEDITERKRTEAALLESEFRYRSIFENALEGIYRSVSGRRLVDVNPAMARMLGYDSPAEVLALNLPDDLFADLTDWERLQDLHRIQDVIQGIELQWKRKDGQPFIVSLHVQTLRDERGHVMFYEGIVTNITERKRAEEALRQSEERYRIISGMMSDYVYAVRVLPGDEYQTSLEWIAGALESITGYSVEEALSGIEWEDRIHPDDLPILKRRRQALLAGKKDVSEFRMLDKEGKIYWLRTYNQPEWDDIEGRVVRIYAAVQDITQRKQMEQTLRQSEERYRLISEAMSDYVYVYRIEPNHKLVLEWIAGAYERITGYGIDEVYRGDASLNIVHPDDQAMVASRQDKLSAGQSDITECRLITRSGQIRHVRLYASPIWDESPDHILRIYASAQDITDRKHVEEALKKSEELYHTLIRNLPASAIMLFDHDLRYLIAEGNALADAGFEKEKVEGKTLWEVVLPESAKFFEPHCRAALNGEETILEFEFQERIYYVHILPVKDQESHIFAGMILVQDITERKRAEEALRESEATLRALIESAPAPMMIFKGTKVIFVNPAIEALSGYTRQEWLTMDFYDVIVPEQRPVAIANAWKRQRGEQVRSRFEVKIIHKSGRELWIDYMATAIQFEGETAVLAIVADITERKQTETSLRQSESSTRALIESIPAPLLIYQNEQMSYVNSAAAALIGYTQDEVCQMTYWDMIHPDMRELVRERGQKRLEGESIPPRYEVKLINKAGEMVWVDYMGTTIQYEGNPAVMGIVFDITARKQAEAALHQSEQRLQAVISNAPLILWSVDRDGIFTLFQGKGINVLGLESHQVIGRSIYEADRHEIRQHIDRAFAGNTFTATLEIYGVVFETHYAPVCDDQDEVTGIMGISLPVTAHSASDNHTPEVSPSH